MKNVIASPLARHPRLLLRKLRGRLFGDPPFAFTQPPAGLHAETPPGLAAALRAWASVCDLNTEPYSSSRVFRQDFDRQQLLKLCQTGPEPRSDLRGDIKLIWEFSRGQAFTLNAARGIADPEAVAIEIHDWIECNNDPNGPNWINAMEIGIRATNWICTDALSDGKISAALGQELWISNLWNSGCAIFQRLEVRLVCSNHYLADLLGLLIIGTVLQQPAWQEFARREFPRALTDQTFPDGGLYEASLPYHALVTEMALLFVLLTGIMPPRLQAMCQILADTMDVDGDVFQVGDNDGGRIIPFDFVSKSLGRAQILLKLANILTGTAFVPQVTALYPDSGWFVARTGDWTAVLEFGGVGMAGRGGHAHNDDLSVSVNWREQRLLVDPGSHVYTSLPASRNTFRSAGAHNAPMLNGMEPRAIPNRRRDDLFLLAGSQNTLPFTQATPAAIGAQRVLAQGIRHTRRIEVLDGAIVIEDELSGLGSGALRWHWLCAPGLNIAVHHREARLTHGDSAWRMSWDDASVEVYADESLYAPFYGSAVPARRLVAQKAGALACRVRWEIRPC